MKSVRINLQFQRNGRVYPQQNRCHCRCSLAFEFPAAAKRFGT